MILYLQTSIKIYIILALLFSEDDAGQDEGGHAARSEAAEDERDGSAAPRKEGDQGLDAENNNQDTSANVTRESLDSDDDGPAAADDIDFIDDQVREPVSIFVTFMLLHF